MKPAFFITIIVFILSFTSKAQLSHPQLRLKLGGSKSIVSSGRSDDNTAYKMTDKKSPLPSGLGLEFVKPLKKLENTNLIIGGFLQVQGYAVGINENFFSDPPGINIASDRRFVRLYVGLEKKLGKKPIPINKNYISVFGGLGLSINGSTAYSENAFSGSIRDGITKDGKHFQGIYYDGGLYPNYFTELHDRAAHFISPDIFGGFRWNIRNKKGNNVLTVELMATYGLMNKFVLDLPYTLDGVRTEDQIKDKGVNVQLNVLIPLKNFGKKKKKLKELPH
jgi:hypothetical protein